MADEILQELRSLREALEHNDWNHAVWKRYRTECSVCGVLEEGHFSETFVADAHNKAMELVTLKHEVTVIDTMREG